MFFIYLIIITIFCLQVDGPITRGVGGGGGGSIPVGSFFFSFRKCWNNRTQVRITVSKRIEPDFSLVC